MSRYNAIFSCVENESNDFLSFRIDRFILSPSENFNTGDWSKYNGHYYSNKAPGVILLGVAVYFPVYYIERLFVKAPFPPELDIFNGYVINVLISGVLAALAAVYFRKMLMYLGLSQRRSVIFSLLFALATPLFPYANSLWGHATSTAFIVFSLYHLVQPRKSNLFWAGLFIGVAVNCDYMTAIYAVFFGAFALWRVKGRVVFFALGGLVPLLVFMWYHWICFGSPFSLATLYNNPIFLEKDKVGGIFGNISSYTMLQLLFGARRGLLFGSPFLLFAFSGFLRHIKTMLNLKSCSPTDQLLWLCVAGILGPLVVNASFNGWHSGSSISPRYLIVSLPLWVLPAAMADYSGLRRWVLALLSGLSFANMFVCGALTPMSAIDHPMPLYQLWYPKLFSGNFFTNAYPIKLHAISKVWPQLEKWSNFNLGNLIGINGLYSLIPVIILSILLFIIIADKLNLKESSNTEEFRSLITRSTAWLKQQETLLMVLLAAGVFLTLLFPGDSTWINDEPRLIGRAFECKSANCWATEGLKGTVGITYGPQAVWFYQLILLFTGSPVIVVFLKTVTVLAAMFYAGIKISGRARLNCMYGFLLFILPPYLFQYNRGLWDNVLLIPLNGLSLAFLLAYFDDKKTSNWLFSILFGYISVYIHPMALPWLGAIIISALLLNIKQLLNSGRKITIFALSIILPALPLVYRVITQFSSTEGKKGDYVQVLKGIAAMPGNLTFYGFIDYFIPEYKQAYPQTVDLIRIISAGQLVFILLMIAVSIYYLSRKLVKKEHLTTADAGLICCYCALILHIVMSIELRHLPQPHYNNAITFALIFTAWYGIDRLSSRRIFRFINYIFFVSLISLLVLFVGYIHIYGGTRGIHYGSTLSNQWQVAKVMSRAERIYRNVRIYTTVNNLRGFYHSIYTMSNMQRPYEEENVFPKVQEDILLVIYHPNEPPSGRIAIEKR